MHAKIKAVLLSIIVIMVSFSSLGCVTSKLRETTAVEKECSVQAETTEKADMLETGGRVLIVYYSYAGITEDIAEKLHKKTGGDLFEIEGDFSETEKNYSSVSSESIEKRETNRVPLLKNGLPDMSLYDLILVGSPSWWKNSLSTPVMSFLAEVDFKGKEVATFCIDQGGVGEFFQDFERQAQNAVILDGLYLKNVKHNSNSEKDIDQLINTWLDELNI